MAGGRGVAGLAGPVCGADVVSWVCYRPARYLHPLRHHPLRLICPYPGIGRSAGRKFLLTLRVDLCIDRGGQ